ncbi:velvet factor-domain-containing protein [Cladochytrium replicatum]|nr:velvet factor-domain-containing protein [Cladochytrium replicatum]
MNEYLKNRHADSPGVHYAGPGSELPQDHLHGSTHPPAQNANFPTSQSFPRPSTDGYLYQSRSHNAPQFRDGDYAHYPSRYVESYWSGNKSRYDRTFPSVPPPPGGPYPFTRSRAEFGLHDDRKQANFHDMDSSLRSHFYHHGAPREPWWGTSHYRSIFDDTALEKPKYLRSLSDTKHQFDSEDFVVLPPPAYPARWEESIEKGRENEGSRATVGQTGKPVSLIGAFEAPLYYSHPGPAWFNTNESPSLNRHPSSPYPATQFPPLSDHRRISPYNEQRPDSWREDTHPRSVPYRCFEDARRYANGALAKHHSYIPPYHYHPFESRRPALSEPHATATHAEMQHAHVFHRNPRAHPHHHHHHHDLQRFYSDQPNPLPVHAQESTYQTDNGGSSRIDSPWAYQHRQKITDTPSMHPPKDAIEVGPDIETFDPGPKSSESCSRIPRNGETKLVYELIVRQQPSRARMIGFGEKDRRPIDPPPIVQLRILNENGDSLNFASAPFLVMHASIWSTDGQSSRSIVINPFAQSNQALSPTALPPGLVLLPSSTTAPEAGQGENDTHNSALRCSRKRQQDDEAKHSHEVSQNKRERRSVELANAGMSFAHLADPRHHGSQYQQQQSHNSSTNLTQLPARDSSNRSPSDDIPPSVGSSENDKAPRESGHGSGSDESTLLNGEGSGTCNFRESDTNTPDLYGETSGGGGSADDMGRGTPGSGSGKTSMMVIVESDEGSSEYMDNANAARSNDARQGPTEGSQRRRTSAQAVQYSGNFFDNPARRGHRLGHAHVRAPNIDAVDNDERDGNMEDDESEDRPQTVARRHLIRKRLHQRINEVQKVSSLGLGRSGMSGSSESDLSDNVRHQDQEEKEGTLVDGDSGPSGFNADSASYRHGSRSMHGQHNHSGHAQKPLSVALGSNTPVTLAQVLVGSLVSPCHVLADVDGNKGMFFVFSDISVRVGGKYRLKFLLYDVKAGDMSRYKASVMSDVFTVYHPKEFPGMADSTPLSKCLAKQGVRIHIRSHAEI